MEILLKYFQNLTNEQKQMFKDLLPLYQEWNSKVNIISRKDIDEFYLHHVLHSLTLVSRISFKPDTRVLDLGCGGGFPGIPLAIFYPDVQFTLIDGTAKKIKVVSDVIDRLQIKNATAKQVRAEEHKGKYHFIVTRAVSRLPELLSWTGHLFEKNQINAIPNGLIAYKGGDLREELKSVPRGFYYEKWDIYADFPEPYFKEKCMVYVQ